MHITNTLQGFSRERAANKGEYNVFVGNGIKVAVESIGFVKLKLSSGFVLELKDVLFVPSMRRSLVSANLVLLLLVTMKVYGFFIKINLIICLELLC